MSDTLAHEPAPLPHPHAKAATPSGPEAQWLVLEYLAADNNLEGELLSDLAEMERVGSTPGVVEVLAQVDRSAGNDTTKGNWHGTRRYYVDARHGPTTDRLPPPSRSRPDQHRRSRRAGELHHLWR